MAAGLAAERATRAEVERLQMILAEMEQLRNAGDLLAASGENAKLHRLLREISRHETATRLIAMVNSQIVHFQHRMILRPSRSARSAAEYAAIVAAVDRGDGEAADAAMRTHLTNVADALRRQEDARS